MCVKPLIAAMLAIVATLAPAESASAQETSPATQATLVNLSRQLALERAGFSPGLIDGKIGPRTRLATREFQIARKLKPTGEFDTETLVALGADAIDPTREYLISSEDAKDVGGPLPTNWNEKAKLDRLRYESFAQLVAERGMTSLATLEWLNPAVNLGKLKIGDRVKIPNTAVVNEAALESPASIEVELTNKLVRGRNKDGVTVVLFNCSVAKDAGKFPSGTGRVVLAKMEPEYRFDPEGWPEVTNVHDVLLIRPGPRNPVGLCWIALGVPGRSGLGIHGTPVPELIGKTGSHGCIRLTNWHAVRLGAVVKEETPVKFTR